MSPRLTATLGAVLGLLIAVQLGVAGYAALSARRIAVAQRREALERVDQTCTLFETSHLTDVQQLRKTYTYLLAVKPSERRETINRFVLAGLPEQERQAHIDKAPKFCDEPRVGLPEPDPKIPKRPAALRP